MGKIKCKVDSVRYPQLASIVNREHYILHDNPNSFKIIETAVTELADLISGRVGLDYDSLTDKPSINGKTIEGDHAPMYYDCASVEELYSLSETVEQQIKTLSTSLTNTDATVAAIGTRLTTAEGNIATLTTKVGTAESNIATLTTTLGTTNTSLSNLTTRVSTAEGNIKTLTTTLGTTNTNLASLTTRVTKTEGTIITLATSITKTNATIGDLSSVTVPTKDSIVAAINSLQTRLANIESHHMPYWQGTLSQFFGNSPSAGGRPNIYKVPLSQIQNLLGIPTRQFTVTFYDSLSDSATGNIGNIHESISTFSLVNSDYGRTGSPNTAIRRYYWEHGGYLRIRAVQWSPDENDVVWVETWDGGISFNRYKVFLYPFAHYGMFDVVSTVTPEPANPQSHRLLTGTTLQPKYNIDSITDPTTVKTQSLLNNIKGLFKTK
jgi:ABC-type transporter Mla subunit MlaD